MGAMNPRGWVWMVIGVLCIIVPLLLGRPLYLRGTRIPWGALLVVVGVGLLIWDVRNRPPTPPPGSPPSP